MNDHARTNIGTPVPEQAARLVRDKTPEPVLEKTARAVAQVRKQILLAAAIQGAMFAVVKASVDRSGAVAIRRMTGTWPG
ncbi:DUF4235 domain-containing protein [Streptomyces sp. NPDC099050]|uniref:DUF4235 domain-containing protein n=1 Tax=Streptomyces sp. NPDC099050 TaxID=3366100 RepID=UPI003817B580